MSSSCSSQLTCSCLHPLDASEFGQEFLACPLRHLGTSADVLFAGMDCSSAWRRRVLNINQLSWAPLRSRALIHGMLPSRSLKRPKSALLKSRVQSFCFYAPLSSQDPELHHLMVTAGQAAFGVHSPSEDKVQQRTSPHWLLYYLGQEVLTDALQDSPGLIMSCCVVLPADIRVVEIPDSLGTIIVLLLPPKKTWNLVFLCLWFWIRMA